MKLQMFTITFTIYIIFSLSVVYSAVYVKAPCPNVKGVPNFNMSAFGRGKWYEIARYSNNYEKHSDCIIVDIKFDNGRYPVKVTEIESGNITYVNGYMVQDKSFGNNGVIKTFSEDLKASEGVDVIPFFVMDIDYNNHAVCYECRYNETTKMRHEYAWIIARAKNLQGDDKKKVES